MKGDVAAAEVGAIHFFEEDLVGATRRLPRCSFSSSALSTWPRRRRPSFLLRPARAHWQPDSGHRASAVATAAEYMTDDFIAFLQLFIDQAPVDEPMLSRPLHSPREALLPYSIDMQLIYNDGELPPARAFRTDSGAAATTWRSRVRSVPTALPEKGPGSRAIRRA